VSIQKSKAEADMCKGHVAQLETKIAIDKKDKECELETLTKKLKQKTEVVALCDDFAASVLKLQQSRVETTTAAAACSFC